MARVKDVQSITTVRPITLQIFMVVCACNHPKLLAVIIMDESEIISSAIPNLFTRFNTFPRVVFYNNACNLAKSIS